jgi:hypothetical protein
VWQIFEGDIEEEENGEKKSLLVLSICKTEFSLLPYGGWGGGTEAISWKLLRSSNLILVTER